jgi:hypothetical protein
LKRRRPKEQSFLLLSLTKRKELSAAPSTTEAIAPAHEEHAFRRKRQVAVERMKRPEKGA